MALNTDGPMTDASTATHSIVVERVMPHPKYFAGLEHVTAGLP
jgi:hypothetical protein